MLEAQSTKLCGGMAHAEGCHRSSVPTEGFSPAFVRRSQWQRMSLHIDVRCEEQSDVHLRVRDLLPAPVHMLRYRSSAPDETYILLT